MSEPKEKDRLPTPEEVGVKIPTHVIEEKFREGFRHSVAGGQLTEKEHFKASFREGFRAGRLFLRDERARRGMPQKPQTWRFKFKPKF